MRFYDFRDLVDNLASTSVLSLDVSPLRLRELFPGKDHVGEVVILAVEVG